MKRNVMRSFVEQAEARITEELGRFEISIGKIPYIDAGAIVGRAIDFLRKNGVPIKGYMMDIHVLLVFNTPDGEISEKLDIGKYLSRSEQEEALRSAIMEFEADHGPVIKRKIIHKIDFLYEESQIDE